MTRASGERWPAAEVAAEAVATNDVGDASGNVQADAGAAVLIKNLRSKAPADPETGNGHPLDPRHRQSRRDRLPARHHQGPGAADCVRPQTVGVITISLMP